jgi:lipoate-protein ligase A
VQQIDLAVRDPAAQLALDETMLLAAEADQIGESIRSWEFTGPTVVVGRSSPVETEVDRAFCRQRDIPILRRCSGGASIVGGPGCLMYSVVLSLNARPELRKIDAAHRFVIGRVLAAMQRQLPEAEFQGTSDLTWRNRKFSGNSLRIARGHLLYHGTILYGADLDLVSHCLLHAPRQPDYRAGRAHRDFIDNVPLDRQRFSDDLISEFDADSLLTDVAVIAKLRSGMHQLRQDRYDDPAWHFRH